MSVDRAEPRPSVDAVPWLLEVTGGRLDGARMSVPSGRWLRVGSSMGSDVVLRDPSVSAEHFAMRVSGAGGDDATVETDDVSSPVRIGDTDVAAGETVRLPLAPVRVGEVVLGLRPDDGAPPASSAVPASIDAPSADEKRGVTVEPTPTPTPLPSASVDVVPGATPGPGKRRRSRRRLGVLAFAGALLASFAGASLVPREKTPSAVGAVPSIGEALEAASLSRVRLERRGDALVALGQVPTREKAMRLEAILAAARPPIEDRTVVVADLLERVHDVFRVQGVEATVASAGGADVEVRTATAEIDRLARVRETVARDLPDVGELVVVNEAPSPPPVALARRSVTPVEVHGKRVAMVISDPPAYVVTEDKSRYFVGALLPSGHRIAAIENGTVSLVKDGRTTELDF